ncbi:hypothetical protein PtrSN002B_012185, partial [Pyrenophora tritici-repentis]
MTLPLRTRLKKPLRPPLPADNGDALPPTLTLPVQVSASLSGTSSATTNPPRSVDEDSGS